VEDDVRPSDSLGEKSIARPCAKVAEAGIPQVGFDEPAGVASSSARLIVCMAKQIGHVNVELQPVVDAKSGCEVGGDNVGLSLVDADEAEKDGVERQEAAEVHPRVVEMGVADPELQ